MMAVNEVSKLTGVSIRTLQYYDTIGLLKPIEYTESGYRLYDDTSLERLQQILLFKELEFPLKEIKKIIDSCPKLDFQYKEDGSDKRKCNPILLFQNIQTVVNQNKNNLKNEDYKLGVFYKFPFHLYKFESWDVEHINSNTTNDEDDVDTQKK